jgi:hypothetical protein
MRRPTGQTRFFRYYAFYATHFTGREGDRMRC